jgi:hypothetical protein
MEEQKPINENYKSLTARFTLTELNDMLEIVAENFPSNLFVVGRFESKKLINNFLLITSVIALVLIAYFSLPLITFFTPLIPVAIYCCFWISDVFKISKLSKICLVTLPKYGYVVSLKEVIFLIESVMYLKKNPNEEDKSNY